MASSIYLPRPRDDQAYCTVSALEAGFIKLQDEMFITNAEPGRVTTTPSLSFLLQHQPTNQKVVFDLGIRRDWDNYPPTIIKVIKSVYPVHVEQDVVDSLAKGGTSPDDIDVVCLSHCHFDHSGNTHPFTKSTFLVGAACQSLFNPGYPADPASPFASDLLPAERTRFLSEEESIWEPIGPFPRCYDLYKDGSLYIVDAPGHLVGHLNVLARTSPDGGWIYLAGDSAHYWQLITGEADIAMHSNHFDSCAHQDKDAAVEHILRIRALSNLPHVRIVLAHDQPWYDLNKGGPAFWPGSIDSL